MLSKLKIVYFMIMILNQTRFIFNQSCTSTYSGLVGTCLRPADCEGAVLNNLCPGSLKCCVNEKVIGNENFVNAQELISITGSNSKRIVFVSSFLKSPSDNPSCDLKASFISQLVHESKNFLAGEEIGGESYFLKYENIKGNTQPGDGARFRGRGFIQITGRFNYMKAGTAINEDLINKPELAAFPSIAAKIAVWYWTSGSDVNLNTLPDGSFYSHSLVSWKINCPNKAGCKINGLADRTLKLEKAQSVFRCGNVIRGNGEKCTVDTNDDAKCVPMCVKDKNSNNILEGKEYCGCNGKHIDTAKCEGPYNIKCCKEKNPNLDLTFVIDSSGSISGSDFQTSLNFVYNIVSNLKISEIGTRVALINFSSQTQIVTYLNSIYDSARLLGVIKQISQFGDSTYTGEALQECNAQVYSEANGMRKMSEGVPKVILVLTDGGSNGAVKPGPVADLLRSKGIEIISVGVGSNINFEELQEIASKNRVILVDNFQQALNIFNDIILITAIQPAKISKTTSKISIEKDSYKYFSYAVDISNITENSQIRVSLNNIEGDVDLFASFTIQNPNDSPVFDDYDTETVKKRAVRSTGSTYLDLNLPAIVPNGTNTSDLYIGAKGNQDYNSFSINVEIVPVSKSNSNVFNDWHLLVLIFINIYLTL